MCKAARRVFCNADVSLVVCYGLCRVSVVYMHCAGNPERRFVCRMRGGGRVYVAMTTEHCSVWAIYCIFIAGTRLALIVDQHDDVTKGWAVQW